MPPKPKPAIDRFLSKTQAVDGGCVEWTGYLDQDGYGGFRAEGGRQARWVRAHRWSYQHARGPIPEGMVLDHLCRNRACVNPDHLEPVTQAENQRRGFDPSVINSRKTHCPQGHEFSIANTYIRNKSRVCKQCKKAVNARRYLKKEAS